MKVLDLFAGIGGFSLGLERTGHFETAAFCEYDRRAREVLRKNWPTVPIYNDVRELTGEQLKKDGISIDVITGGFPCQDLSFAGRGAGLQGDRSGLWFEYLRLIKEITPQWVIIENVSALRSRGLDEVLRGLSEIGYDAEWHCIPASAVGAPHQRDRIWIVAYPHDQRGRSQPPVSSSAGARTRDQPSRSSSEMAYAKVMQRDGSDHHTGVSLEPEEISKFGNGCWAADLAYASSTVLQGGQRLRDYFEEAIRRWASTSRPASQCCPASGGTLYSWATEPNVGRVAHGVPGRVDRLKQLGNAVVPQIPELIGRAIHAATTS